MAGLDDALTQNPWIDSSRLAITGLSYSDFMTN
jgi:dipeptidyl aminopeptidase/acylaminoacyl peptidase